MGKHDEDAAAPQLIKPGDDPEVDRLLAKLKQDCDDGDPFFVNFRKRPRAGTDGAQVDAAPVERPALAAKGAAIVVRERPAPAASAAPAAPTAAAIAAPPATDAASPSKDAAAKKQRRQAKLLALGVLGIVGPIIVLALGYLMSKPTVVVVAPAGVTDGTGQVVGMRMGTAAAPSTGGTASGAPAPAALTLSVSAQADAGAARPSAEPSAAAPVKGQPWPKKEAPRVDAGAVVPGAGKPPDPGEDIW
jgi:hypothetical protein